MTFEKKSSRAVRVYLPALLLAAAVAVAVATARRMGGEDGDNPDQPVYTAKRGPLLISVSEAGTIGALDQVEIKSEVEGQTTIIFLVEEGKLVEKGDLLVELDAASLKDSLVDQQIRVNNAEAAFIGARENLAVVRNQASADISKAELDLQFAREDLVKYEEGEYPKQVMELEAKITLAHEDLEQAAQTLEWSEKLFNEQYISKTEFERDELAKKRAELDYDLAKANLDLFMKFTHQRKLDELRSSLKQAELALERVRLKASADIVQAESNLKAKESEYERNKDKLGKIEEQIIKTRIVAPKSGMVVYATTGQPQWRGDPLQEGSQVRERQALINLPSPGSMMAEIKVHESALEKIAVGQPAVVTVDALPGRTFEGRVVRIAPLPDASMRWMNPDIKRYDTKINLDGNAADLRTGMSCRAEIMVAQYGDVLAVPIQAVIRVKEKPTVFVRRGRTFEPRKIETGMDNNRMVHVVSGLDENDVVSLTPPLEKGQAPAAQETSPMKQEPSREAGDQADARRQQETIEKQSPADQSPDAGEQRRERPESQTIGRRPDGADGEPRRRPERSESGAGPAARQGL